MSLISPSIDWRFNRLTAGPYHVEIVGPYKLPQVCGPGGVVGLSGPNGAVFQASVTQAEQLCAMANAGELSQ